MCAPTPTRAPPPTASASFAFTGSDNLTPTASLQYAWRVDGGGHVEVAERRRLDERDLRVLGLWVDNLEIHDRFLIEFLVGHS